MEAGPWASPLFEEWKMVGEDVIDILRPCIKRGLFQLHSGRKTNWRFDVEEAQGHLRTLMLALSPSYDLAGIWLGGSKLVLSVDLYAVIVYKTGTVCPGPDGSAKLYPVSLVDDVVTTEASFKAAEDALVKNGYVVAERLVVLDRRKLEDKTLSIRSLVTAADLGLEP